MLCSANPRVPSTDMNLLILSQADVERLLPMNECIPVMEEAFVALAQGEIEQPLRTIFRPPTISGVMAMMPSFRTGDRPLFGLKAICVFPRNAAIGKDAHQGGVMLFDGTTGELLAIANASAITAIRTAAVSALATRILAKTDACELAIIGAGVQARAHLSAIACVRPLKEVRVAARRIESAERFAKETQPNFSFPIIATENAQAAVLNADVIVTATTAREPVIRREWLLPGVHINAVGTYSPKAREIDSATMAGATIFTDRRESILHEAGDYLIAAEEGLINRNSIAAELGEVLVGSHSGRTSADEITLFKSLGLAIEDLAAAAYLYQKAKEENAGTWAEFN
jgi:ornithine cyclodeaminase